MVHLNPPFDHTSTLGKPGLTSQPPACHFFTLTDLVLLISICNLPPVHAVSNFVQPHTSPPPHSKRIITGIPDPVTIITHFLVAVSSETIDVYHRRISPLIVLPCVHNFTTRAIILSTFKRSSKPHRNLPAASPTHSICPLGVQH